MTTARQYNNAVDDVAYLRKRLIELTKQNIGLEQRVEELQAAVEDVNRIGVLKIRELEARNAELKMRVDGLQEGIDLVKQQGLLRWDLHLHDEYGNEANPHMETTEGGDYVEYEDVEGTHGRLVELEAQIVNFECVRIVASAISREIYPRDVFVGCRMCSMGLCKCDRGVQLARSLADALDAFKEPDDVRADT